MFEQFESLFILLVLVYIEIEVFKLTNERESMHFNGISVMTL